VADVWAALQVVMGAHPRDPWSITAPLAGPAAPGRVRVAVVAEPPGGRTDPRVASAVRRAVAALAESGYKVVDACPPLYEDAVEVWLRFLLGDFALVLPQILPLMGASGAEFLSRVQATVKPLADVQAMSQLLMRRDQIARGWSMFMAEHPLSCCRPPGPSCPSKRGLMRLQRRPPRKRWK
jgi:amidase